MGMMVEWGYTGKNISIVFAGWNDRPSNQCVILRWKWGWNDGIIASGWWFGT
jgi:hypothetical protein